MIDFKCPNCGEEHSIKDLELWEVYEGDGKETELACGECGSDMVITSRVTGWVFEASLPEDLQPIHNGRSQTASVHFD